jgi:acyl carrier protein
MSIYETLVQELVGCLGLRPDEVRAEATFIELGVDSLLLVELGLALEEEHGIDAEGIDPRGTLAQAADYLQAAAGDDARTAGGEPVPGSVS